MFPGVLGVVIMSLPRFAVKRTVHGLGVFWVAVSAVFALRQLMPGDVVIMMTSPETPPEVQEQIRERLGLNRPVHEQYIEYMSTILQGDLGYSHYSNQAVWSLVEGRLIPTVELAFLAMFIAVLFAIPFGIISAKNRNSPKDLSVTVASLFGVSTPNFWLGLMLILAFAVWSDLLPVGRHPVTLPTAMSMVVTEGSLSGLTTWIAHITLPAITLGTYYMALLTRLTRGGMIDELGQLYITAAEAKGLPTVLVHYKYALKNTLIPLITIVAINIGGLLGGSVVVESVFDWPGLGQLFITALNRQDWPVVQSMLILVAFAYVSMNAIADVLYTYVNPEVELE